jgi:squalene synthase HpnC
VDPAEFFLRELPPADALLAARRLAAAHYENFAVSSRFIPAALRGDFARLYAFCRATDDLGDEAAGDRTALLTQWREALRRGIAGEPHGLAWPLAGALALIRERGLPQAYFTDLIDANLQDQRVARYADWDGLAGYARLSANCVGRLVLRLFSVDGARTDLQSDAICTGLQYANFWQDIAVDFRKGRIYLPECEWLAAGVREADFGAPRASAALRELLRGSVLPRTRSLFAEGEPLQAAVPAPLRRQLSLYLGGGRAILRALERQDCDPLRRRPTVGKFTKLWLGLNAFMK